MAEALVPPEREARRRAILDSAIRTFADHGFVGARTRDIAAGAGVAEGTLYLYFEGKDDLLLTAFREQVRDFSESIAELLHVRSPFRERLTRFIEMQFRRIESDPSLATVLLLETRHSTKFYGEPVREVLREYANAVDALLQGGVDEGAVRADLDLPLTRRILVGALEEIGLNWLLGERARALSPLAPEVAKTFFHGVAAAPANA